MSTLAEIENTIKAEKDSKPVLAVLDSDSVTAVWRLWVTVVAFAFLIEEELQRIHKQEVDARIARNQYGILSWYAEIAKLFQQGDPLVVIDGVLGYAPGSTGEKVVKRATAKEALTEQQQLVIYLKVAGEDALTGEFQAISPAALVQLEGYIDRRKPAGAPVVVISRPADRLKLSVKVYYDPLLNEALVKQAVIESVANGYLKALEFDGIVYRSRIEDAIQAVPGVIDVEIISISARNGADPAEVVGRKYETKSGYIIPEDTAANTFDDTIEMVPNYGV